MTVTHHKATAVKRLLRDFKEVLVHPLPNVVASPQEDDIFVWHGNVRGGSDSVFTDTPFHFKLTFLETYPLTAPTVSMYTRLPHPNITKQAARPRWRLAIWDCSPTENGWSCAYTVHSILLQLQAFLIAEDMMWHTTQGTLESAIEQAADLTIEGHLHTGKCPYPAFPTEEALALAAERNKQQKILISSSVQICTTTTLAPQFLQASGGDLGAGLLPAAKKQLPSSGLSAESSKAAAAALIEPEADTKEIEENPQELLWQVVHKKGRDNGKATDAKQEGKAPADVLKKTEASPVSKLGANQFAILAPTKQQAQEKEKVATDPAAAPVKACDGQPGKAAKRNARRSKKRAAKSQPASEPSPVDPLQAPALPKAVPAEPSSSAVSPASSSDSVEAARSAEQPLADWKAVPTKQKVQEAAIAEPQNRPIAELILEVKEAAMSTGAWKEELDEPSWSGGGMSEMGSFTYVPLDIMTNIFGLLDRKAITMVGSTCRGLRALCGEGEVWRLLLQRDFSGSQITASKTSDWKSAYLLQSHNIVGELQCYFSKASFEDEVLGMPANFTVNPRTGSIDYIQVHPELLSVIAHKQGVVATVSKSEAGDVQIVIPAYLNEEHFQRALPLMPSILRKLTLGVAGNAVGPAYWLDACGKMMNTAVVLLMDKGMEASQKAISSYCTVHRLLLALADTYNLWDEASNRLDAFLSHDSHRSKEKMPNLGWLIALLTVSPKHKWGHAAVPLLMETLDRNVLWSCKAKQSLVQRYRIPEHCGGVDDELLEGVFESSRVGLGLLAFHSAFLHYIARPPGVALDKVMEQSDVLFGRPSEGQVKRMQAAISRIQAICNWEQQLQVLGVQPEGSPDLHVFMTKVLRRAWQRSLQKGYHSKSTDFSRIHASGVSKILLKGQSYTTPPNMRGLEMMDVWRWEGPEIRYLDTSMLVYGKAGLICTVDWQKTRSWGTKVVGALQHSSDILDMEEQKGMQLMSVRLSDLGDHVTDMYLVASVWAGLPMSEVKQPHVLIKDSAENMTLCEYHLEERPASREADSTCIVMCRLEKGQAGRWTVQAVGEYLSYGCTMIYGPIFEHVEQHRRSLQAA